MEIKVSLIQLIINPNKNNPKHENATKKRKKEKKKRKRKNKDNKVYLLLVRRDSQQWQITFIALNNNGFCLLNIYLSRPSTPSLANNQLMGNI